jgi:hypothetical protein
MKIHYKNNNISWAFSRNKNIIRSLCGIQLKSDDTDKYTEEEHNVTCENCKKLIAKNYRPI